MNRWRIYLKERFPLAKHAPLIAVFSFCAVSYSAALIGVKPNAVSALLAFVVCQIAFLHLRLADEFKDIEEDRLYRPYRPVPRGLVSLRELGILWIVTALIQFTLTFLYLPALTLLLFFSWFYLGFMSVEFFARDWLKARPVIYLLTHMGIMPLVDLFATGCAWMPVGEWPGNGLLWFLSASFSNGIVIELGRKIWAVEDEIEGVNTYSKLWGWRAAYIWAGTVSVTAILATIAATYIGLGLLLGIVALFLTAAAFLQARFYHSNPRKVVTRWFEPLSGMTTLSLYGLLGIVPMF